jgi:hypothetical protein
MREDSMSSIYSYDELQLQLIDDNKEFNTELSRFMKEKWNLANCGFDYNVVAVFGSQSTGKSTLLNRLFHTNFSVMDEQSRQQTTKGIWLSEARERPMLIMDVEGTDGRERGEEQDFERKSALFFISNFRSSYNKYVGKYGWFISRIKHGSSENSFGCESSIISK